MAGGWARDGAAQEQIEDSLADAVKRARARLPAGEGLEHCEICGEETPEGRRRALLGTRTCIACQSARDAARVTAGIKRRGSKDSQLRQSHVQNAIAPPIPSRANIPPAAAPAGPRRSS